MVLYIVNNYDNNNNQSYEFISGDPKNYWGGDRSTCSPIIAAYAYD